MEYRFPQLRLHQTLIFRLYQETEEIQHARSRNDIHLIGWLNGIWQGRSLGRPIQYVLQSINSPFSMVFYRQSDFSQKEQRERIWDWVSFNWLLTCPQSGGNYVSEIDVINNMLFRDRRICSRCISVEWEKGTPGVSISISLVIGILIIQVLGLTVK